MQHPTGKVEFNDDGVQVDADTLTRSLRVSSAELKEGLRDGSITSRFEKGEGEDEGRVRLTFFSANCRVRITANASGTIIGCNAVDFGNRPLPAAMRNA